MKRRLQNLFSSPSRSVWIAFAISLLLFGSLLLVSSVLGHLYSLFLIHRSIDSVTRGVSADLAHLHREGDVIAQNELLKKYIESGDSYRILGILSQEKDRRNIGLMGATNKEGVIISRTKTVSLRGDNVFLTSPQGRVVATGQGVSSIEVTFGTQLLMTTGRPVLQGKDMIGGLFANYLMDDAYATKFKAMYLPNRTNIIFYTNIGGVYGDSFTDPDTKKLLASYIHPESDWIKKPLQWNVIRFGFDQYYLVERIIFPGLEHSPGGALVFVPYYAISGKGALFLGLCALLYFLYILWRDRQSHAKKHGTYYYGVLACIFIVSLSSIYILQTTHPWRSYVQLKKIPYPLYNSTLRIQPESGVFSTDFERTVEVLVDTGDEYVNSVSVSLVFDPAIFSVEDIITETSFCSFFLEKIIDNKKGTVQFSCGLPNPGFSGNTGTVMSLRIKPKAVGTSTFVFTNETRVLANDGLGTDVLRFASNASYTIEPSKHKGDGSLVVFSSTHPNSARWYATPTIDINWGFQNNMVYVYALDAIPDTIPSTKNQTTDNNITLTAPHDGVFYFHIATLRGAVVDTVTHFKIQIDTSPPSDVVVKASADSVAPGDLVRLEFTAKDAMSGLQKVSYVSFGSGVFLPVGQQVYVPMTHIGIEDVVFRVYDQAGNYVEKQLRIRVEPSSLGTLLTYMFDRITNN